MIDQWFKKDLQSIFDNHKVNKPPLPPFHPQGGTEGKRGRQKHNSFGTLIPSRGTEVNAKSLR